MVCLCTFGGQEGGRFGIERWPRRQTNRCGADVIVEEI